MTTEILAQGNGIQQELTKVTGLQAILGDIPETPSLDDLVAFVSKLQSQPVTTTSIKNDITTAVSDFMTAINTALTSGVTALNTTFTELGNA